MRKTNTKKHTAQFLCIAMLLSGLAFAGKANDGQDMLKEMYIYAFSRR